MKHNSTSGRGGESTTGAITIHHIHIGNGYDSGSGNGAEDADNYIVSSSSPSYWGCTTKQKNEDILQHRVVCVKRKRVPEDYNERDIHHGNATKALFQTFGAAEQFVPKNLDGGSKSTKYTEIQSEYVGNLENIKLLKSRIMA